MGHSIIQLHWLSTEWMNNSDCEYVIASSSNCELHNSVVSCPHREWRCQKYVCSPATTMETIIIVDDQIARQDAQRCRWPIPNGPYTPEYINNVVQTTGYHLYIYRCILCRFSSRVLSLLLLSVLLLGIVWNIRTVLSSVPLLCAQISFCSGVFIGMRNGLPVSFYLANTACCHVSSWSSNHSYSMRETRAADESCKTTRSTTARPAVLTSLRPISNNQSSTL